MLDLISADLWRVSSRRLFRYGIGAVGVTIVVAGINAGLRPTRHFVLGQHLVPTSRGVALVVAILAMIYGSSSTGADWATRVWWSILSWEPRRLRVTASRYVAGAVASLAGFGVVIGVLIGSFVIRMLLSGGVLSDGDFGLDPSGLVAVWSAGAYLVIWGGVLGMALGQITRNTAAGITLGVGVCVGAEFAVRAWAHSLVPWSIGTNAQALLGIPIWQPYTVQSQFGPSTAFELLDLGVMRPLLLLSAYLALVLVASLVVSRVRDVR